MNSFFFNNSASHHQNHQHQHPHHHHHHQQHTFASVAHSNPSQANSHSHHGGRSRRAPRTSSAQNAQRQFRGVKSMRELAAVGSEPPTSSLWRVKFEAGRCFDLSDDEDFIPGLLTEEDRSSVDSLSDRSSLASGSPDSSPLQHQIQPTQQVTPALSLSSTAFTSPTSGYSHASMKLHQPSAVRTRNAIPIVNPSTGVRISSPPNSISPGMLPQLNNRRW